MNCSNRKMYLFHLDFSNRSTKISGSYSLSDPSVSCPQSPLTPNASDPEEDDSSSSKSSRKLSSSSESDGLPFPTDIGRVMRSEPSFLSTDWFMIPFILFSFAPLPNVSSVIEECSDSKDDSARSRASFVDSSRSLCRARCAVLSVAISPVLYRLLVLDRYSNVLSTLRANELIVGIEAFL